MNKSVKIFLCVISIVIMYAIYATFYGRFLKSRWDLQQTRNAVVIKNRQNYFDSSEIDGKLIYISKKAAYGDAISVSSNPNDTFYTSIFFNEKYSGREFKYVANVGDSIIKHRFSQSLILITKNNKYYCLFK